MNHLFQHLCCQLSRKSLNLGHYSFLEGRCKGRILLHCLNGALPLRGRFFCIASQDSDMISPLDEWLFFALGIKV